MNDAHRHSELGFEQKARDAFERSVAELDAGTRARLTRARVRALRQLEERRAAALPGRPASWVAAGAAAAIAISFAWLLPDFGSAPERRAEQLAASPDSELLLDDEELDMLQDLDFYSWLDRQARQEAPASGDDAIG